MKNRLFYTFLLLLFALGAKSQSPSIVYDGNKLSITVSEGRLEFQYDKMANTTIRDCFDWGGRETCMFMAKPDAYTFPLANLSGDEEITLEGVFNGEEIMIPVEMLIAPKPTTTIDQPVAKNGGLDLNMLILIGVVVVLLLVVLILVVKNRKKKPEETPCDPGVISVIADESIQYERGLKHVKEHLNEYLTFDMDMVFKDSAINKVYFSTALIKKLYDFFNSSLEGDGRTNETGCFILGCWDFEAGRRDRYDISLEYMVEPGDDADFGEYSLNFGKKISINMASVIDNLASKSKRDYVLTCWMHSHPGLGLFLSNPDLVVQQTLAYSDHKNRLLAIVIDTNTPNLKVGFFAPMTDGKMNNKEEVIRWFSFEDIYNDSRQMTRKNAKSQFVGSNDSAPDPNYFNLDTENGAIRRIGFSAHAINQIDDVIYNSPSGVIGYFYGNLENGYLLIDTCLSYENEEKMGCLILGAQSMATLDKDYASDVKGCLFFVNCSADDTMQIWITDASGQFVYAAETTLTQMKEWIRRKRV